MHPARIVPDSVYLMESVGRFKGVERYVFKIEKRSWGLIVHYRVRRGGIVNPNPRRCSLEHFAKNARLRVA